MDKRLTNTQCMLLYSKYLNCHKPIGEFCQENDVPYLEFVKWINNWEESHGARIVEQSMQRQEQQSHMGDTSGAIFTSLGERLFKPLVPEYNRDSLRSARYFPENPYFETELGQPIPDTVLKDCSLTFPSGVTLTIPHTSLKTLILSVVLYEEFGSWSLEQA